MNRSIILIVWIIVSLISQSRVVYGGELIDRVVASVGTTAITLSEFQQRLALLREKQPSITEDEVINSMINGLLLLEKARQLRIEGKNSDDLIAEYVNLKIRSAILIRDEQIDNYLRDHHQQLGVRNDSSVREKVEELLIEQEFNKALEKHIKELRETADIRIQLSTKQ